MSIGNYITEFPRLMDWAVGSGSVIQLQKGASEPSSKVVQVPKVQYSNLTVPCGSRFMESRCISNANVLCVKLVRL